MTDKPITVLCVDVDRHLLGIFGKALEAEGCVVLRATDGDQALRIVAEAEPNLVVLDITLPKRDGFSVLEEIRKLSEPQGSVPVLLTCGGRVTPQYEARASALGAHGVLGKPVALKEFIERARGLLQKTGVGEARPDPKAAKEPSFEGDIAQIRLPHSLHQLHGLRATGVLMISSARKKKAIELRDGYPVAVQSNLVTECLGPYLVREGKLSEAAVDESVERMKRGEGLQGEILVAMNVITPAEIEGALRAQAEDKLFEMFAWRRGEFRLAPGGRLKRANPLAFETSPVNIILEGIRRRTHAEDIDTFLTSHAEQRVAMSASPDYPIDALQLDAAERAFLGALDGTTRLGEIASEGERLRRTVYGLIATELLELRASVRARASVAAAPQQVPVRALQNEPVNPVAEVPRKAEPKESGSRVSRSNPAASERESNAHASFRAGTSLLDQKSYEAALREFRKARDGAPRNADHLAHYGWCLYLCNPTNATVTQEALAHLRQSVKLARDTEKPYLLLGRLNKVLGDTREAEKMFERAVQIRPDCLEALRELRLMNMRKGTTSKLIGKLIGR